MSQCFWRTNNFVVFPANERPSRSNELCFQRMNKSMFPANGQPSRLNELVFSTNGQPSRSNDRSFYRMGDRSHSNVCKFFRTAYKRVINTIQCKNGKSLAYVFPCKVTIFQSFRKYSTVIIVLREDKTDESH